MSAWPFETDALKDDPLTARRIAVVTSFNPMWHYTCAYLGTNADTGQTWEPPWPFASAERPTDAEAAMLESFRLYHRHYWSTIWGYDFRKMDTHALDTDSVGYATVFIKYGADDWGYRKTSWTSGPTFVPGPPSTRTDGSGPLSLEKVMDRFHHLGERSDDHWAQWKAHHPDIFPTTEETT